ncbi:MAG: hypothetical protein AAF658_01805 [Myxococcota bacterium]
MKWTIGAIVALFLVPVRAYALPTIQTGTGASGEASVSIMLPTQSIEGDARSYCEISVEIRGEDVELREEDTINVRVFESDFGFGAFDDELWRIVFSVTREEAQAGLVQRTFDCSTEFTKEGNNEFEIYGAVTSNKAACNPFAFCSQDVAETDILSVAIMTDDMDSEPNNLQADARALPPGATAGYIARDDDFFVLDVENAARLVVTVDFRPEAGGLVVNLLDDAGVTVAPGIPTLNGTIVELDPVLPGSYALHVTPENANDFAFYSLNVSLDGVNGQCTSGDVQEVPCGNCGTKTSVCENGFWGTFTACSDEGVCTPGETATSKCGACGQRADRCSDSCQWVSGSCSDDCAEGTAVLGESCRSTVNCISGLDCLSEQEYPAFVGGYCGVNPCASDSMCGGGGVCANVFGAGFCLNTCADDAECRAGYSCAQTDRGRACVPRCTGDEACGDPQAPVCNVVTGSCEAGQRRDTGDGGIGGTRDANSGGVEPASGGCTTGTPVPWFLGLGIGLGMRRRRRRSTR